MKKYIIIFLVVFGFVFIPFVPFVICWGIDLLNKLLSNCNFKSILQINYPFTISIEDYLTIIFSLLSCYITGLLGWIAYKLSLSIRQHDLQSEKTIKVIIRHSIKDEVYNNLRTIEKIENKVHKKTSEISIKQYVWIVDSNNLHLLFDNENDLVKLKSLYDFFENYKNSNVAKNDKLKWLAYDSEKSTWTFREIDFI